jgi:hypothetical protein
MQELSTEDPKGFQNFLRMGKTDFQELLAKVTSHIQRQNTWMVVKVKNMCLKLACVNDP